MSVASTIRSWFAAKPKPASRVTRNFFESRFDGARRDRTTHDWMPGNLSLYSLHRADAGLLRERARDLVNNNPHAASAVGAYIANVIECGIMPKPRIEDVGTRRKWQDAWEHWAANEADITGCQHLYQLQALWLEEVIVGGGCLMVERVLPRTKGRRIQAAIELVPEERFADDMDTAIKWRNSRKSANPITRGIELDAATGRPVAFHIRRQDPNDAQVGINGDPVRIPAENARYSFFRRRVGQYRGFTLLAPVIMWLWKLGYYTDNELLASTIKSCFSAVITTEVGPDFQTGFDGDPDGITTDIYGNTLEKLQPGIVGRLRPGESITAVGPNVPGSDSIAWLMMIQRAISIGLDLSYEELGRDYSKGSFSSVRAAANADRKRFYRMQDFVSHGFCDPSYRLFARWAVMAGIDGFPTVENYVAEQDEWLRVRWQTPGWTSVNPKEDASAADIRLKNGSTTLEDIAAAEGYDWEDRLEQRARELNKARELGIELESDATDVNSNEREPANNDD